VTGLREPPKPDRRSRVVARFFVLILLLVVAGGVIWVAATNERVELVEDESLQELELEDVAIIGGLEINLIRGKQGVIPVIMLHDRDITGSPMLAAVAAGIEDRYIPVRIDLPGFGLSTRIPQVSTSHTVASMAEVVSTIIADQYDASAVLVGVGLGGKVAAEIAVTNPDLVRGVVLVDVDFWPEKTWQWRVQRWPFVGEAATYTLESGGQLAYDMWAPKCTEGGWCPTADQERAREQASEIIDTTASLNSFLQTPVSAVVPSDLDLIASPVTYIWSTEGTVSSDVVKRLKDTIQDLTVIEVPVWKAHLEKPEVVIEAITKLGG
jgi:pimeloyl-ACP methyl ester carboxylesterase